MAYCILTVVCNNILRMLHGFCHALPILTLYDVFYRISGFALSIRYFILHNLRFILHYVNIRMSIFRISVMYFDKCQLIYFSGGGKLKILILVPLPQDVRFLRFSIMSLSKLYMEFLYCYQL